MQGACADCPAQATTVRLSLEEPLREALPGIGSVIPV
ncbi:MAG: NifU family protein, partial [Deltaproteobacteria bacterium]|nr:NifU family protein [Deltaproteobacteria bacterium]